MKAIILAAGRGSRMGSLTSDRPKALLSIRGRSLLDRQLCSLRKAGISSIGIVTGYMGNLLQDYCDHRFHNAQWEQTNMFASLRCADAWLQADTCIVSYSDIFYEHQIVSDLVHSNADIAIAYDPNWLSLWSKRFENPLTDAETFRIDAYGRLLDIGGMTSELTAIQGQYMGLLRFTPEGWAIAQKAVNALPKADADKIHMTGMLAMLVGEGHRVWTVPNHWAWGEVDSQSDAELYESDPSYL